MATNQPLPQLTLKAILLGVVLSMILGACAVGRFSSGRMNRDRGNFVVTTAVPDFGTGNRRAAPPRGVNRSPIGSMAVPNRRHWASISVTRSPEALACA